MGLDMFAFTTTCKPAEPVDFNIGADAKPDQLFYWRKHPNLHGWMEQLYRDKGGTDPDFNGNKLILTADDLVALEADVNGRVLPETTGFFFGTSRPEEKQADLDFIAKAREAITNGLTVYYDSWW